jgi:GAF domain-containing protein
VEIGEQQVAWLEHRDLLRLRLLDLHDHVAVGKDGLGIGDDARAGLDIVAVLEVDSHAGAGLDDHLMAGSGQLGDRRWGQSDTIFVVLDFPRHTDAHVSLHHLPANSYRAAALL